MNATGVPTSGIDGNSEGGRIASLQTEPLLELYGVALVEELWKLGERGSMTVQPVKEGGIWCIELTVGPEVKAAVPVRWYGRRVIVKPLEGPVEKPSRPGILGNWGALGFNGPLQTPAHPAPTPPIYRAPKPEPASSPPVSAEKPARNLFPRRLRRLLRARSQ